MSKKFKTQDYFRYKRLGKRWRSPKGLQSKLRKGKAGSGKKPSIGRKKQAKAIPLLVKNINDVQGLEKDRAVLVSSAVGTKKAVMILEEAEKLGLKVQNRNNIKRSEFLLKKKQEARKKLRKEKEEKKKTEEEKPKAEEAKKDKPKLEEAKKEKAESEATLEKDKKNKPVFTAEKRK